MNISHLPPELIDKIFQLADCAYPLRPVCKSFAAARYFDIFFQVCADDSPSLTKSLGARNKVTFPSILKQHEVKPDSQKYIGNIYNSFINIIKPITEYNYIGNEDEVKSKIASLRFIESVEQLHQLDRWFEDISLIALQTKISEMFTSAETCLAEIQEKNISEKARAIRQWLGDNEKNLETIEYFSRDADESDDFCLIRLTKEIGYFTNLKVLRLENYCFTSLPKEIGNLSQLTDLIISNKDTLRLELDLPKEISNLTQLTTLNLEHNNISSLPEEMGNLTQLKILKLPYNKISRLPKEIGKLTQLTFLNLSYNNMSSLPEEMGNLTQLQYLDLRDNAFKSWTRDLKSLPEWIQKLLKKGFIFKRD